MNTAIENKLSAAVGHLAHIHGVEVNHIVFRSGLVYFNVGRYTYYVKMDDNGQVVKDSLRLAPTH